jgi:hypothetical protein
MTVAPAASSRSNTPATVPTPAPDLRGDRVMPDLP